MDIETLWVVITGWADARTSERGASLVEYALLIALIAVVCVGAMNFLSGRTQAGFSNAGSSLN
jgi:pilus assembly protein Flp/PilA